MEERYPKQYKGFEQNWKGVVNVYFADFCTKEHTYLQYFGEVVADRNLQQSVIEKQIDRASCDGVVNTLECFWLVLHFNGDHMMLRTSLRKIQRIGATIRLTVTLTTNYSSVCLLALIQIIYKAS